jgi:hypothetical protein
MSGNDIQIDGYLSSLQSPSVVFPNAMKDSWPDAMQHPLFYIGIYAIIGLVNVLVGICATIAQYTGAFRASRTLFRCVAFHLCFHLF